MSEGITPPEKKPKKIPERVRVTSYPKMIFLWPTWVLSFFIWLIAAIGSLDLTLYEYKWVGWLWVAVFAFNLFVVAFDFAAGKFLAIVALIFIFFLLVFLGIIPLNFDFPNLRIGELFYLVITVIFGSIYFILWLSRRFNYLEVTTQQVIYRLGIFADERRYPAPSVHFEKKTDDVFERIIPPFCAKLLMQHEGGGPPEILDCVPWVSRRLEDINEILEHLKVKPTM
ncbi:MAG: hypothetical protein ACTSRS_13685 [Candidatus Helarchaeota archaeon]